MTNSPTPRNRYPGLRSFQDREIDWQIFFGRDREKYDLLQLVLAERLVVLYARSGLGKTSLINAGLMQPLREKGYFPMVLRVNGADDDPLESLYRGIETACDRGIERKDIDEYEPADSAEWNRTSLWHFFKTFYIWKGEKLLHPVVILDQFEELFTLISEEPRTHFIDRLADLVRGMRPRNVAKESSDSESELSDWAPDVKLVLSIREDYLANLEDMVERIPTILSSRFRLEPLKRELAKFAIVKPAGLVNPEFETAPFSWSEEALQCTLDFLCKQKSSKPRIKENDEVEPFQLQLICQKIESLVQEKELKILTLKELGGEVALKRILEDFYEGSIDDICKSFGGFRLKRWFEEFFEDRKVRWFRLRRRIENFLAKKLIAPSGHRVLREEDTIVNKDGIKKDILAEMVHHRLIRKEPQREVIYYELTHDTLIVPILKSFQKRVRRGQLSAVLSVLFILSLTSYVSYGWYQADKDRRRSREVNERIVAKLSRSQEGLSTFEEVLFGLLDDQGFLDEIREEPAKPLTFETAFGEEILGELRDSAPPSSNDPNWRIDRWNLVLDEGEQNKYFNISLTSNSFEELIFSIDLSSGFVEDFAFKLMGDDAAQLCLPTDSDGYEFVVSSLSGTETGNYQLAIETTLACWFGQLPSDDIPLSGELVLGEETPGNLTKSDRVGDFLVEKWEFELEEGQHYSVALSSPDFDTYLVAHTPDGRVGSDDDLGGELNSQLCFEATSPGRAQVIVSSFSGTENGNYQLEILPTSKCLRDVFTLVIPLLEELPPDDIPLLNELVLGEETPGNLTDSDRVGNFIVQKWELELEEGQEYSVALSSPDFDTYLVAHMPDGQVLIDDDSGGGLNSQLCFEATSSGTAQVIVSSFFGTETGNYQLEILPTSECLPEFSPTEIPLLEELPPDDIPLLNELVLGEETPGNLTESDRVGDFIVQKWELELEEGQQYSVALSSPDFDTYLVAHMPDGQVLIDDDSGGGLNSQLCFEATSLGKAQVLVSSFFGTGTGNYQLEILPTSECLPEFSATEIPFLEELPLDDIPLLNELVLGEETPGNLTESDRVGDFLVQKWELELEEGQEYSVALTSPDFDTYLVAHTPDGQVLSDDDSGDGYNSNLNFVAGQGPTYILVSSFNGNAIGNYQIVVDQPK